MYFPSIRKTAAVAVAALAVILLWRWVLPVALPFLLGALMAFAAEPLVVPLSKKLPRAAATGIGVTAALLSLFSLLVLLTTLLLRQVGQLTDQVPVLLRTVNDGLDSLHDTLTDLSVRMPESVQPMLRSTVENIFRSGGTVVEGFLQRLPAAASAVLSYITDSALAVGTGCLAAYMISSRLPRLRQWYRSPPPDSPVGKLLPRLKKIRHALWGWLKAQLCLSGMSFLILLVGLSLLGIRYSPVWALFIALVDAVPLLGTGTVLIPWALVGFLQGSTLRSVGLLAIYAVTFLTRSAMEPRLVGRQLGLDPLVTLISLYAGYQFWGFGGMIVSPLLCVIVKEAATAEKE